MKTALINARFTHKTATVMLIENGSIVAFCDTLPHDYNGLIIDAQGEWIYPGFIDAHMHLAWYGQMLHSLTLFECTSHSMIQTKIATFRSVNPALTLLQAKGYNESQFQADQPLNRQNLDMWIPDIPCVFTRVCNHVVVVNSPMLAMIVAKFGPNLDDTVFEKDAYGEWNGVIKEHGILQVNACLPSLGVNDYVKFILTAANTCLSYGITCVGTNDLWVTNHDYLHVKKAYDIFSLHQLLRISHQIKMDTLSDFTTLANDPIQENDFQTRGPLKTFADGSLGGRTALLSENYVQTDTCGLATIDQAHLEAMIKRSNELNMQVVVHAIGDRAIDNVAAAFTPYTKDGNPLRHAIIHVQITRKDQIKDLAKKHICGMVQPVFLRSDALILQDRLSPSLSDHSYAWKTMIDEEMNIAFSSDAPIEEPNVFVGMHSAITRLDAHGVFPHGHNPSQCIDIATALRHYTTQGAYLLHKEQEIGKLEVGYKADCFASSRSLESLPHHELLTHRISWTMVNGNVVYRKETAG